MVKNVTHGIPLITQISFFRYPDIDRTKIFVLYLTEYTEFAVLVNNSLANHEGNYQKVKDLFDKHSMNNDHTVLTIIGGSHGNASGMSAFSAPDGQISQFLDSRILPGYEKLVRELKENPRTSEVTIHLLDIMHFHCHHECNISEENNTSNICNFHCQSGNQNNLLLLSL